MNQLKIFEKYAFELRDSAFKGARGGQVYNLKFSDRDVEVYPGIYTHSRQYVGFLHDLYNHMSKEFPIPASKNGRYLSPPPGGDFTKLLTLGGSIRPLTYSPSRSYLDDKSPPEHIKMMKRLVRIMYHRPCHVDHPSVSNMSSSGAPLFANDARTKLEHLRIVAYNIDEVVNLLKEMDFKKLNEKFGIVFLTTAQIRRQADKWKDGAPKVRQYVSYVSSYTGDGSRPFLKEETIIKDYGYDIGACRTRVVNAYSGVINNLITSVIAPMRDSAEDIFSFTFKHRTQEEKKHKLEKFPFAAGLDVSQYDAQIKYDMFEAWVSELPTNDDFKNLCRVFVRSPFYSAEAKMCDGDIYNPDTFMYWRGLPSGVAFTSCFGKIHMVALLLCGLEKVINRTLSDFEIERILKGESRFGILNMSDDTVLMGDESTVHGVTSYVSESFNVEYEDAILFLGDIAYDAKGELQMCHSLESYLVNWYVPERSINSKLRPYAMYGARDRRKIFSDNPLFKEADKIVRSIFRRHFNDDIDLIEERHMVYPPIGGLALSLRDVEALVSFEKLFYKFDKGDVSDRVRDLFVTSIPEDILKPIRQKFDFNGVKYE